MGVKQAIKKLDAFPRPEEHLLQKTQSGAIVSIIGLVIMATLFIHELRYYLTTYTVNQMSVDLKRGETLPIHINMTFPSLPCDVLSVDAIDMSGKHEVDLDTNIWKLRLSSDGHIIGTEYLSDLVEKGHAHGHSHDHSHDHGHDKHEHEDPKDQKNRDHKDDHGNQKDSDNKTEHEVQKDGDHKDEHGVQKDGDHKDEHGVQKDGDHKDEHNDQKDSDHKDKPVELKHKSHLQSFDAETESMVKKVKQAMANGEGCRVYGVLDVQRVAGNFHISVHGLNIFVAQMIFDGSNHVNVSHIIHDLSFGPKYPGIHNPLDGTSRILRGASGTYKYYIKIVPTEYRYISKDVLPTNQFSVTEYFSPMKDFDRTWPAVYFLYDLSPITVTIREERRSFLHFLTRLCAVLGGTFALTGMLDRWMYRFVEAVMKPTKRMVF
ncbi:uncharacterized protein LOC130806126 [Amaranthus tricolor]|uniref:uncharacterized protein LOC130806126 n=1 Tax=Amaranthus tricolor TaxID=29722 RepID=UPI00258B6357|nr:uncharacterized protein LOC130806126 [Amaranthus tricolor]